MAFYEEMPKWDETLQEVQEIAEHIEQSQYHNISLGVESLASEQDLQSIVPDQAEVKSELVVYIESLPNRFAEYSLLTVEEKVKRWKVRKMPMLW